MWPGAASHELLKNFGQASAIFLVSWAEKKVHIRSWEPLKNSEEVSAGPVEVDSALPAGPGASFEMSYIDVKDDCGEGPCFRSLT